MSVQSSTVAAGADTPVPVRTAGVVQGLTLAFAGFLPVMSILSLAPVVPTLIDHFKSVPFAITLIPMMVAAPGLMVALLAPLAGVAVDRYGRRNLILWATFIYGFSGAAPLFLEEVWLIFVSRLMVGASETFILVIVNALYADYFTQDRRRNWLMAQGVIGPILGTGSIALAGWLTSFSWNGAFLIYLSAFAIYLAMLLSFFEPARASGADNGRTEARVPFPWRMAARYCGVTLFVSILYYVYIIQSGVAFKSLGVESSANIGLLVGLATLGTPVGAVLFSFLAKRWSSMSVIATLLFFVGLGTLGMGLAPDIRTMVAAGFVEQIGGGMTVTGLIFWVSKLLPSEHRGRGFGLWTSAFFAGQFISPAVMGIAQGLLGGILPAFTAMGLVALAGAVLALMSSRRRPSGV